MLSLMILFSGVKILFRVGLVLLKFTLGSQEKLKTCQGLYETMEVLRAIKPQYMQEGFLVHEVFYHLCYLFYCFGPAPSACSDVHLKAGSLFDFALLDLWQQQYK